MTNSYKQYDEVWMILLHICLQPVHVDFSNRRGVRLLLLALMVGCIHSNTQGEGETGKPGSYMKGRLAKKIAEEIL